MAQRVVRASFDAIVVGFALLAATGALAREATVSIDGQRVYAQVLGAGRPTVVFEAGQGTDSSTWERVARGVAKFATVVVYDRAGLGRSQPPVHPDRPVTAHDVATRLHALLAGLGLPPPYVLVGHSLGGLYVQMFARMYPREVAGAVLLDAASPDAPAELKTLAPLEPGTAAFREEAGVAASNRQVASAGPFPAVPLVVIAATDHGPRFRAFEPTMMRLQRGLAALSPKATFIVARDSGHDVHTERPVLVIDAIEKIVGRTLVEPTSSRPRFTSAHVSRRRARPHDEQHSSGARPSSIAGSARRSPTTRGLEV
jgi:pimeloyl-ACP methyl ester carboxylesterase